MQFRSEAEKSRMVAQTEQTLRQSAKFQPSSVTPSPKVETVNEADINAVCPASPQPPVEESPPSGEPSTVVAKPNRAERRRRQREHVFGGPLSESDYVALERCAIVRRDAEAMCGRVDDATGSEMFNQNGLRNYAGIIFRIEWPGEDRVREYLLRRDAPEIENGKPQRKYVWPTGRGNILLFAPGTRPEWLNDVSLPIVFCEGPKKMLALWNLAWHGLSESSEMPRFCPAAVSGVWNFRGRVGKQENERGERVDERGLINDFSRINFKGREVCILYDRNVHDNREKKGSVNHARNTFAKELRSLGARVLLCDLPADDLSINGVDDYAGRYGLDAALKLYDGRYDPKAKEQASRTAGQPRVVISELPSVRALAAEKVEFLVPGLLVKGTITLFSGPPASGKTTLALWLGDAIARGSEILGGTCEQHPVLYLTKEVPLQFAAGIVRRFRIGDGPTENMLLWGPWNVQFPPAPADPNILQWVGQCESPPLLIFDPLVAFLPPDASENDSVEIRSFFAQLRTLLQCGAAAVVVLHHPGKSEKSQNYRGSSDIEAAVDAAYKVTNTGDGELDKLVLKLFKPRFIDQAAEMVLVYSEDDDGVASFTADNQPAAAAINITKRLTDLLTKHPGLKTTEFVRLAMTNKVSTQYEARTFLKDGVTAGRIVIDEGRSHNAKYHRIADDTLFTPAPDDGTVQ